MNCFQEKLNYCNMPFGSARLSFKKNQGPKNGVGASGIIYLGFKESSAVVPDLSVLSTVGGNAHRCCSCVRDSSSNCQILVLGSVLYSDVHSRLWWEKTGPFGENLWICKSALPIREGWEDTSLFLSPFAPTSKYIQFNVFIDKSLRLLSTSHLLCFLKSAHWKGL